MSTRSLSDTIAAVHDELVTLRHDIHRHPEPGFEERLTGQRIREQLGAVGLEARECADTGLLFDIGAGDGPTIALRADMDCLRMTEENPGLAYRSERDGLAHMCGHDGHTATLVGAGRLLAGVADSLPGRVRLVFQPAEEGPGGAAVMIEQGCLDGVDEIYGMHNWPTTPLGALRTVAGPCMATVAEFSITVHGTGGHASQPQDAADPIVAAAQLITALQTVVSRNVHYQERAVVSVTMVNAGEAFNVIPETAVLRGTVRALSAEVYTLIERRIGELSRATATAMGCRAEVEVRQMYPVLVNSPAETAHVQRVARKVLGEDAVGDAELPMLGAEDFAYFLQERPGCFFFLGGGEPGRSNAMCHSPSFDFNDKLIAPGIELWIRLVEDWLGAQLYA